MSLPSEPVQVSTFHFKVTTGGQDEQEHHQQQQQQHHQEQQQQQQQPQQQQQVEEGDFVESKFEKEILPSPGQNNELRIPVFITKDASKVIALSRLYTDALSRKYQKDQAPIGPSAQILPSLQSNEIQEEQEQHLHPQVNPYSPSHFTGDGFIGLASQYNDAHHREEGPFDREEEEGESNYRGARVNFDTLDDQLDEPMASGSEEQEHLSCPLSQAMAPHSSPAPFSASNVQGQLYLAGARDAAAFADGSVVNSFFSNSLEPSEANHYETWAYPSTFVNLPGGKLKEKAKYKLNLKKHHTTTSTSELKKHVARNYMSKALNTYFNFILEFQKQRGWPRF